MKRAILHIGTEKTGSTSVQQFLFLNREALARKGWLFPASAGYLSNHRLVVYAKRAPEADLTSMAFERDAPSSLSDWKEGFVADHCREVMPFLAGRWPRLRTLVYSSEHLQSRLTTRDEIARVARLIRPLVDRIDVVVYLRRQDRLALSAHSTSIRAGDPRPFRFEDVHAEGPYYDHLALLENWSAVFGRQNLTVRLFERDRLEGGDVVRDFANVCGATSVLRAPIYPEVENEALSWTAQAILLHRNTLPDDHPSLVGIDRRHFDAHLLAVLQRIDDAHGKVLPPRAEAEAFLDRFRADNAIIADRWLAGKGFDDAFDDYPSDAGAPPSIDDAAERFDRIVDDYRASPSARAA